MDYQAGKSFNRTILELKFNKSYEITTHHILLIEPYWNWNGKVLQMDEGADAF